MKTALRRGCPVRRRDPHQVIHTDTDTHGERLGVGLPQLLGVDVVPAIAGQVRPVGRGGQPAVGDPHHPVQPPPAQVVLDPTDDRGIGLVAGEGPGPVECS